MTCERVVCGPGGQLYCVVVCRSPFGFNFGPVARTPSGARGVMSQEVDHREYISLLDRGHDRPMILWHHGTGDMKEVERCRLEFRNSSGLLVIDCGAGPGHRREQWVNDVLDASLHVMVSEDGHGQHFVYRRGADESVLVHKAVLDVNVHAWMHECDAGSFGGEVYEHQLPAARPGCRRFITLPFVQDFCFGDGCHNRWACRNYPRWILHLRFVG